MRADDPIDSTKARKIGEIIEARRVVWGSFNRKEGNWQLRARIVKVASGETSIELNAVSKDWFELCDSCSKQLLQELRIEPTQEERLKMSIRPTESSVALEWRSKAYELYQEGRFSQAQDYAGKALTADSQFFEAYAVVAGCNAAQGKYDEAEKAIRQALLLNPDYSMGHNTLGTILLFQGKEIAALVELLQAHTLDPEDSDSLVRLGEVYKAQKNWERALFYFNEAKRLSPVSAAVQAHLGHVYALRGEQTKARVALKEAERLDGDDLVAEQMMSRAYDVLHETSLAIEHYDKLATLATNVGLDAKTLKDCEERAKQLKATLVPVFLSAQEPKLYTDQALHDVLADRLNSDELASVVNPLAADKQMATFAGQLTQGATNDLQKAKQLFDGLVRHLDQGLGGTRTARESFKDWDAQGQSFSCQEYARLYAALARSIGLKCFYALVNTDFMGKEVFHACAALFTEGKVLLIDPRYRWFGAPHKGFEIIDDLQAVVNHLNQSSQDLARTKIAGKLNPASGYTQYRLALSMLDHGKTNEARAVLDQTLKFAPNERIADYAQGVFALRDQNFSEAVRYFRKSIERVSDLGMSHFGLAQALTAKGELKEARNELRATLQCPVLPDLKAQALQAIAQINERIGSD